VAQETHPRLVSKDRSIKRSPEIDQEQIFFGNRLTFSGRRVVGI
jgi:hypothetical protein